MALKPDRFEDFVITDYFMNEVAQAGVVVVFDTSTSGVGASLDDANAKVKLPVNTGGSGELPAGILVGPVVNKDLTQTHLNQYNRESQVGGKVGIARNGTFNTNMIASGVTPGPGIAAYFTATGNFTVTSTNSTRIGTWLSAKDPDGYAKVRVNIA